MFTLPDKLYKCVYVISLFLFHCQGTQRRRQVAPSQTSVTAENMQDFIFDPNEAYAYYLNFVKVSINDVYSLHCDA